MAQQRLAIPDILKGIAVLLMIQVHISELFAQEVFYYSYTGKMSLFLGGVPAAPLFMAVMGFFAGYRELNLKTNIVRGIRLILLGLLLNIGLNLHLFYRIFKGTYEIDPMPYLFGADILFLAGTSLIVIALLKKVVKDSIILFIIISAAIALMSDVVPIYNGDSLLLKYILAFIHSSDWWSYFPLLPWLAYPLIGVAAGISYRKSSQKTSSFLRKPVVVILPFIPFLLFFKYGFNISSDLPRYYHHGIAFFAWTCIFLILIVSTVYYTTNISGTGNKVSKYLQWTGRNVTAFYVVQWLIIGNIATAIYKTQPPLYLLFWYTGIVIITSILVLVWNYRDKVRK